MSRIGDVLRQGMTGRPDVAPDQSSDNQPPPPFSNTVFMHPSNMALLAYWRVMRGVKTLPAWAQIDLLEISEHLKNLVMLEWPDGTDPTFRFAGPDVASWIGTDPVNKGLTDVTGRDLCAELSTEAGRLQKAERLLLLQTKYDTKTGGSVLLEKLCMPLCDDQGDPRYFLIACQWMSGSLKHRETPDALILPSMSITQKILLPPEADKCHTEALDPGRRHPWVTRTSSVS